MLWAAATSLQVYVIIVHKDQRLLPYFATEAIIWFPVWRSDRPNQLKQFILYYILYCFTFNKMVKQTVLSSLNNLYTHQQHCVYVTGCCSIALQQVCFSFKHDDRKRKTCARYLKMRWSQIRRLASSFFFLPFSKQYTPHLAYLSLINKYIPRFLNLSAFVSSSPTGISLPTTFHSFFTLFFSHLFASLYA